MRTIQRVLIAGTAALAMAVPAAAQAAVGDVYVADRGSHDVWKLGPAGGDATSLAAFEPTDSPYGLTLGPDGFLYVADEDGPIWRVDRATGAKSPVTDFPNPANPIDVAFDPQGRMLVVDYNDDSLSYVDLSTGARTPFATSPAPSSGYNSLAILRDGTVFVSDENDNAVYRFTPQGVRTTVAEDDPELADADGAFLTPDERFLYVGSYDRSTYVRFDLQTGARQVLPTSGAPYDTTLGLDGNLLYSNGSNAAIERGNLDGGLLGAFSADTDFVTPRGIAVEPPLCGGKMPTVVGTPSRDVLRGSAFADVILTQGGKDTVTALAGNDIVCGGPGKDVLKGGPGKDRLLGQAGKDKLIGGKGKDKLKGGAGEDVQKQ
jgi:Ca2+-binding RTX toxin-like protein